jgi:hypothetical protein
MPAPSQLSELSRYRRLLDAIWVASRPDRAKTWAQSYRAKDKLELRATKVAVSIVSPIHKELGGVSGVLNTLNQLDNHPDFFTRSTSPQAQSLQTALANLLKNRVSVPDAVIATYVSFSLEVGQVAGQSALDKLGIDSSFVWSDPQAEGKSLFQARGSKIIQNAYGNHIDDLSRIIIEATDPANNLSIADVQATISKKWGELTSQQAMKIARTETASAWSQVTRETYRRNGVKSRRVAVAVDASTIDPICEICLEAAAEGFIPIDSTYSNGADTPPFHPNCRCDEVAEETPLTGTPFTG